MSKYAKKILRTAEQPNKAASKKERRLWLREKNEEKETVAVGNPAVFFVLQYLVEPLGSYPFII